MPKITESEQHRIKAFLYLGHAKKVKALRPTARHGFHRDIVDDTVHNYVQLARRMNHRSIRERVDNG